MFRSLRLDANTAKRFAQYLLGTNIEMGLPFVLRIQGQNSIKLSPEEKRVYLNEFTTTMAA